MTQKPISRKSNSDKKSFSETIEEEIIDAGKDVDFIRKEVVDSGKDVDFIRKEVVDSGKDLDELKEDVDEIIAKQKSLLKRIPSKLKPDKFAFDDIAQQIVGAIIVSSPLAVTQEVWMLAQSLDITRLSLIVLITLAFDILLIYYTKYQSVEKENVFKFIPLRLVSLLGISYLAAMLILFLFGVIGGQVNSVIWASKLILFVGLFANIGAGAADILK